MAEGVSAKYRFAGVRGHLILEMNGQSKQAYQGYNGDIRPSGMLSPLILQLKASFLQCPCPAGFQGKSLNATSRRCYSVHPNLLLRRNELSPCSSRALFRTSIGNFQVRLEALFGIGGFTHVDWAIAGTQGINPVPVTIELGHSR